MADEVLVNDGGSTESTEAAVDNNTAVDNGAGVDSTSTVDNGDTQDGASNASTDSEQADIPLTEKDGKQFIPYERFKQVLDQRENAVSNFLESVKADPEVRKQLAESLGLSDPSAKTDSTQSTGEAEATPFAKFLGTSVDPQHHEHYQGFAGAIAQELEAEIDRRMAPIMDFIGATRLKEVSSKLPDFGKYQGAVTKKMQQIRGLDAEDAYKIVAWEDKMKSVSAAGARKEAGRLQGANKAPITRNNGVPGGMPKAVPKDARSAAERAYEKWIGTEQ